MKNFILKNKTIILIVISLFFLLGFCKKQSDVKKINKLYSKSKVDIDSLNNLLNTKDSIITIKDLELSSFAEKDGVKTSGCEKQITLLENTLMECKYDKDRMFREIEKLNKEKDKLLLNNNSNNKLLTL